MKAESDILCTSRNAVEVVNSIPADKPILFLPDINLGNYVKQQTGRENMRIWQGACIVHATFPARRLTAAARGASRRAGGGASGVPAPMCSPWPTSSARRRPSSTGALRAPADEFIVMTESGVRHSLETALAGEAVLLRPERELQLQRVSVHEAATRSRSCATACAT